MPNIFNSPTNVTDNPCLEIMYESKMQSRRSKTPLSKNIVSLSQTSTPSQSSTLWTNLQTGWAWCCSTGAANRTTNTMPINKNEEQLVEINAVGTTLMQLSEQYSTEQPINRTSSPYLNLKDKKSWFIGSLLAISALRGASAKTRPESAPQFTQHAITIMNITPLPLVNDSELMTSFKQNEQLPDIEISNNNLTNNRHHINGCPSNQRKNQSVIRFLRKQQVLDKNSNSKEALLAAAVSYLSDDGENSVIFSPRKVIKMGRAILADLDFYGGKDNERINHKYAESVIGNWFMITILGCPLVEYLTRAVATSSEPVNLKVINLAYLLALEVIESDERLNLEKIPDEIKFTFTHVWNTFVRQQIPILSQFNDIGHDEVKTLLLSDERFAALYTGSRYLYDLGKMNLFSLNETEAIGHQMWDTALNDGIKLDETSYFLLPALLSHAQQQPERINSEQHIDNITLAALNDYIQEKKNRQNKQYIQKIQQDINTKFTQYESKLSQWSKKAKLANDIIAKCPEESLSPLLSRYPVFPISDRIAMMREQTKQLYMNGSPVLKCASAPPQLADEYQRLTQNVANSFFELDNLLIYIAFISMDHKELDFILAPNAMVYSEKINMKTTSLISVVSRFALERDHNYDVTLDKTDLFCVTMNNEERVYAMKNNNGTYAIIRVDRKIQNYITADLLTYKQFGTDYTLSKYGNKDAIVAGKETLPYSFSTDKTEVMASGDNKIALVNHLCTKHRDAFYSHLYDFGNDQSNLEMTWHIVKHVIPFYDCIDNIIQGDVDHSLPACLLDVIGFIPVIGQSANLGTKFGMSLTKGVYNGAKLLGKNALQSFGPAILNDVSLPTIKELSSLGGTILKAADPGVELAFATTKKLTNMLIFLFNKNKSMITLAHKLASIQLPIPRTLTTDYSYAYLPNTKIVVPVKKIVQYNQEDNYVLVSPDSGLAAGIRYKKDKDDMLIPNASSSTTGSHTIINSVAQINPLIVSQPIRLRHFLPRQGRQRIDEHIATNRIRANICADFLIPGKIDHYYSWNSIYGLDEQTAILNPTNMDSKPNALMGLSDPIKDAQHNIRRHVHAALRLTQNAIEKLTDLNSEIIAQVDSYLTSVLNTVDPFIINEAKDRILIICRNVNQFLNRSMANNYKNFHLIALNTNADDDTQLIDITLSRLSYGFVFLNDPLDRINLYVDNFLPNNAATRYQLADTILHEASHLTADTQDFFYLSPNSQTIGLSVSDFRDRFERLLSSGDILTESDSKNFINALKNQLEIPDDITDDMALHMIRTDVMLQANLIIANADCFFMLLNELSKIMRKARDTSLNGENAIDLKLLNVIIMSASKLSF